MAALVNNLLQQLAAGPACDVAIVGYSATVDGRADVGCRWSGTLAGREFVATTELAAAAQVESRTRRVPQADGTIREEPVSFSIWYEPALGSGGPQVAAFGWCRELIERRGMHGGQALLIHVFAGSSADGKPQKAMEDLLAAPSRPIVVQCHVAASTTAGTTAFPSRQVYLTTDLAKELFPRRPGHGAWCTTPGWSTSPAACSSRSITSRRTRRPRRLLSEARARPAAMEP